VCADPRATNFPHDDSIRSSPGNGQQSLHRLVHRLVTQSESAVMHWQDEIRAAVVSHLPDLLRIRMGGDVRVISADAKNREIHFADVAEAFVIRGIAAVENLSLAVA